MKTLFLFAIILSCYLPASAQNGHKTLQECGNDTLQYALVNFEQNKERYRGQKMEMFLNELDFKIMDFFPTNNLPQNPPKSHIVGIMIYADSDYIFSRKEHDHRKRFIIRIYFDMPPYKDKAEDVYKMRREDDEWGPKYYDLFKDYKIKNISVSLYE